MLLVLRRRRLGVLASSALVLVRAFVLPWKLLLLLTGGAMVRAVAELLIPC